MTKKQDRSRGQDAQESRRRTRRAFLRKYGILGGAGVFLINDVALGRLVDEASRVRPSDAAMLACDCGELCGNCHCACPCTCVCNPQEAYAETFQLDYSPNFNVLVLDDKTGAIAYTDVHIRGERGSESARDSQVRFKGRGKKRRVVMRRGDPV